MKKIENINNIKKKGVLFLIALIFTFIGTNIDMSEYIELESSAKENIKGEVTAGNTVEVHYIDVGQADCILIKSNGENMLIDAGNNNDYKIIEKYLEKENVKDFKYVVATHAHEDHIGSMDFVVNNYDVEKVYMAKHSATTKTFRDFVSAVKNKGLKLSIPLEGEEFTLGNVKFKCLTKDNVKYDEINNYSIVLKATYKNIDYIFTGDAEKEIENEILENHRSDLSNVEVLKVGHHGSSSSSTKEFIQAISPEYSIIQVGKDNSYNHPAQTVLEILEDAGSKVYRTDKHGTIVVSTDGVNIEVQHESDNR